MIKLFVVYKQPFFILLKSPPYFPSPPYLILPSVLTPIAY